MKVAAIFVLCTIAAVSCQHCYEDTNDVCTTSSHDPKKEECTAEYGRAKTYMHLLSSYVNEHITRSFQYLLMSSYFGNYQKSREGFQKLYRKLSDEAWEDAIDLMKYITLRGGVVDLKVFQEPRVEEEADSDDKAKHEQGPPGLKLFSDGDDLHLNELQSLGKAVDIQIILAERSHKIYNHTNIHDPEMGSYIEDKFMHKHAETIRKLVGLTNDLKGLVDVKKGTTSVGLQYFIIDEYIKKYF